MSCGKVTYQTRALAIDSIRGIKKDKGVTRSKKQPNRIYFCDACDGFHLTSGKKKRIPRDSQSTQEIVFNPKKRDQNTFLKIKDFTSKKQ